MIEVMFFICLGIIAYGYVGYPLLLVLLDWIFGQPEHKADITPRISLIITAYNEEQDIEKKIENAMAIDYPRDRLEIIVASDCSSDLTDEKVRQYEPAVVLCRMPCRVGKTIAQNKAVAASSGEILVFSDATTLYHPLALRKLVRGFASPDVGCIAGQLVYKDVAETAVGNGCVSYWSYEKFIRSRESRIGSLIGVSGCIYAVRRSCYPDLAREMSSDFVIAGEMGLQSLKTIYEPEALCFESTNQKPGDEFRMRVRVVEQTITAMAKYRELLNPARFGLFAFELWSHKVIRYLVPWCLAGALFLNLALAGSGVIYDWSLALQGALYGMGVLGWALDRFGLRLPVLGMAHYFLLANAAAAAGFVKFLLGESHIVWSPVRGRGISENA